MSVVKHVSDDILVMYLGTMVELAKKEDMFYNRLHPYTKALLEAVPIPQVMDRTDRKLLKGEITSPIDPKPGCRFASRCEYATEICFNQNPYMIEAIPEHFVACHHVMEINNLL
jgi:peptide/nickel transport system ATP-binding protein